LDKDRQHAILQARLAQLCDAIARRQTVLQVKMRNVILMMGAVAVSAVLTPRRALKVLLNAIMILRMEAVALVLLVMQHQKRIKVILRMGAVVIVLLIIQHQKRIKSQRL
jgi:hypothetical protein